MKRQLLVLGLVVATVQPALASERLRHVDLAIDHGAGSQRILESALETTGPVEASTPSARTAALVVGGTGVGTAVAGGILLAQDGSNTALGGALVGVGVLSSIVGGILYYRSSALAQKQAEHREEQPAPAQAVAGVDPKRVPERIRRKVPIVSLKF